MSSLTEAIEKLVAREDLTSEEAFASADAIARGVDPCQAAAFLVLLRSKGETADEIAGMVRAMRTHMVRVDAGAGCVDIVGTGGDGHHTVNISTAASVVAAACGAKVAKHGNRSVSSKCGSADVLEKLGVRLDLAPAAVERCVREAGIAFMFAPAFHPAMKNIVPVRKALGVRTVFNILGPLLNPASCPRLLIGVYTPALVELMAHALHAIGVERAMVVHCCGLDELAPIGVASVATVGPDGVSVGSLDPVAELGMKRCTIADLAGGDATANADALVRVLGGQLGGAVADTVALNAGAGLFVAGVVPTIKEGCERARASMAEGAPLKVLREWARCSQAEG